LTMRRAGKSGVDIRGEPVSHPYAEVVWSGTGMLAGVGVRSVSS
jgi:hypothetical protein